MKDRQARQEIEKLQSDILANMREIKTNLARLQTSLDILSSLEKGGENLKKRIQTIISLENAINQAVAENRVVNFDCDAPNSVIRDSIRFTNLRGCKVCKDTPESRVVNVIPENVLKGESDGKNSR